MGEIGGPRRGVYELDANGAGTPQLIIKAAGQVAFGTSFSPDGKWALVVRTNRIFLHSMENAGPEKQISPPDFQAFDGYFSPDGRRIAYTSDESGALEVYVQAFSATGERRRVSTNGGRNPAWSHDGHELFFLEDPLRQGLRAVMAVRIDAAGAPAGPPRKLFEGTYIGSLPSRNYDVTPDGRFIMVRQEGATPDERVTQLRVVLGWGEQLKQRVPSSTPWR